MLELAKDLMVPKEAAAPELPPRSAENIELDTDRGEPFVLPHVNLSGNKTVDHKCKTLMESLYMWAEKDGSRQCMMYHDDKGRKVDESDRAKLLKEARAVEHLLTHTLKMKRGDTALLVYPFGLDFTRCFLGCQLAGIVAVPCVAPDPSSTHRWDEAMDRLERIAVDCSSRVALTDASYKRFVSIKSAVGKMTSFAGGGLGGSSLSGFQWVSTSNLKLPAAAKNSVSATRATDASMDPQQLSFLQYTSGSTGAPKGVMVTHERIRINMTMIATALNNVEETVCVSWLPHFHDMGLIGSICTCLFNGGTYAGLSAVSFMRAPILWLQLVSRYKASHIQAPDFSYSLCVRKYQGEPLDLSCVTSALSGAEPIHVKTLDAFNATFGPMGFKPKAWACSYGLAEAVLFVSSHQCCDAEVGRMHLPVDSKVLANERRAVTGCGDKLAVGVGSPAKFDIVVKIVDVETMAEVATRSVGEIWVHARSVARGYWNNPKATRDTFQAQLDAAAHPDDRREYLRTGDMGFYDEEGTLYIMGRMKNMLIINGVNYYPADMEIAVTQKVKQLRPGNTAVMDIAPPGSSQPMLAIASELRSVKASKGDAQADSQYEAITSVMASMIAGQYGLSVHTIVLLKPGGLPKTSSGKIRHVEMREALMSDDPVAGVVYTRERRAVEEKLDAYAAIAWAELNDTESRATMVEMLKCIVECTCGIVSENTNENMMEMGVTSVNAVQARSKVEEMLQITLPPTFMLDHPTVESMADLCLVVMMAKHSNSQDPDGEAQSLKQDLGLDVNSAPEIAFADDAAKKKGANHGWAVERPPGVALVLHTCMYFAMFLLLMSPIVLLYNVDEQLALNGFFDSESGTCARWCRYFILPVVYYNAYIVATMVVLLLTKKVVLGRVKPGRWRLYSLYHLRFCFIDAILHLGDFFVMSRVCNTPIIRAFARALGTRIGRGASLPGNAYLRAFELLSIDDGSAAGGSRLSCYTIEDGHIVLSPVSVGKGCVLANDSYVGPGCTIKDGATLTDKACVSRDVTVAEGETWTGIAAEPVPSKHRLPTGKTWGAGASEEWWLVQVYKVFVACVIAPWLVSIALIPAAYLGSNVFGALLDGGLTMGTVLLLAYLPYCMYALTHGLILATCKWLLLGCVKAGTYDANSFFALRLWTMDFLVQSMEITHIMEPSIVSWLTRRCMGVKESPRCLVAAGGASAHLTACYDMLTINEGCFVGGCTAMNSRECRDGKLTLTPITLGKGCWVGAHAYIAPGVEMAPGSMLAASSALLHDTLTDSNSLWIGPEGKRVCAVNKGMNTANYSYGLAYVAQFFIAMFTFAINAYAVYVAFRIFVAVNTGLTGAWPHDWHDFAWCLSILVSVLAFGALSLAAAAVAKAATVGHLKKERMALFSFRFWLWVYNYSQHYLVAHIFLPATFGDRTMVWYHQLRGATIAKDAYVDHHVFIFDEDLIKIDSGTVIQSYASVSPHTFTADGCMAFGPITIGKNCEVRPYAQVHHDTTLLDGCIVDCLTRPLSGEVLAGNTTWVGVPARPQGGAV